MVETISLATAGSLLSGGAAGAIITLVVTAIRNRKQPIGYRSEIVPVFTSGKIGGSDIVAKLNLHSESGGSGNDVPNLHIAEIELTNRGNKDFPTFKMGLTLTPGNLAVHCAIRSDDRHHQATVLTTIGPGAPQNEIDFQLAPFNRRDVYRLKLYLVAIGGADLGPIQPGSSEPVVFTQTPAFGEVVSVAGKIALEGALKLPPFK